MKFGPVPVNSALGATLAHSQTLGGKRYRKGQILTEEDINAISNSGIINITVAELESDDIRENDAAQILRSAAYNLCVNSARKVYFRVEIKFTNDQNKFQNQN